MANSNKQFVHNIIALADERKIPRDTVVDSIKDAIIKAYVKEYPESNVEVEIDLNNESLIIKTLFNVVEDYDDLNDYSEISVEDAKKEYSKDSKVGDVVKKEVDISELETSIINGIKQLFKHNITSESNKQIFSDWTPRVGEVINAEVERNDSDHGGSVVVNLGNEIFGSMPKNEQIPDEKLLPGKKYNFLIKSVKSQASKDFPITLSRADSGYVKYLLTEGIPEIKEGIIEIKAIARSAGFRTKVAVISHQASVPAVGVVIGSGGSRIKSISEQINNERIEVIEWEDNYKRFVVNACLPAEIVGISIEEPETEEDKREVTIIAKPEKFALLIGKKGANVKILSQLLNADVRILNEQEAEEDQLKYEKVEAHVPYQPRQRREGGDRPRGTFHGNNNHAFPRYDNASMNGAKKSKEDLLSSLSSFGNQNDIFAGLAKEKYNYNNVQRENKNETEDNYSDDEE